MLRMNGTSKENIISWMWACHQIQVYLPLYSMSDEMKISIYAGEERKKRPETELESTNPFNAMACVYGCVCVCCVLCAMEWYFYYKIKYIPVQTMNSRSLLIVLKKDMKTGSKVVKNWEEYQKQVKAMANVLVSTEHKQRYSVKIGSNIYFVCVCLYTTHHILLSMLLFDEVSKKASNCKRKRAHTKRNKRWNNKCGANTTNVNNIDWMCMLLLYAVYCYRWLPFASMGHP